MNDYVEMAFLTERGANSLLCHAALKKEGMVTLFSVNLGVYIFLTIIAFLCLHNTSACTFKI